MENSGFDLCHRLMDEASLVHLLLCVTSKSSGRHTLVMEVSSEAKTKTSVGVVEDGGFHTHVTHRSNTTASQQNINKALL